MLLLLLIKVVRPLCRKAATFITNQGRLQKERRVQKFVPCAKERRVQKGKNRLILTLLPKQQCDAIRTNLSNCQ